MNYHDISVKQFQRLTEIATEHPEDSIKHAIAYLYNVDPDTMPMVEYTRLLSASQWLNGEIPTNPLAPTYKLNGRTYAVDLTPGNFTTAQYTDLTNYAKAGGKYVDVLSVVMIPDGHKYNDGYDMERVRADLETMGICDAHAVAAFFFGWSRQYTKLVARYLRRKCRWMPGAKRKEAREQLQTLLRLLESYPTF